jgi:hypothetical protein
MEVLWILALFVAVAMALLVPAWGGMAHEG